ncbi:MULTISPECIES: isopentenyl-diphosphate Delta-isomerase [unclassified Actinopolyspora]|uniref:isopentenyl-diphosphate Delta-isomerase n=1 Tax=unclassified Actinopolyspora TaxID=2639451 RepID=UPI0013F69378|nr:MULTISPECIES: isopentenyl-diphosphate Delta-isomerase [unclassified Actinopolyspora]NHD15535.1 isopentenyl-diphosphate Delta-isomerase [Actinopolyspora sp. BKK2]NHE75251.1 isopentenyl-diphosphate Delta-isomerase [Actinopolyspora sp. BKK1]
MNSAPSASATELVVLLDETANPVGTAPKSEVHHGSTPLHLAFSCYVFDRRGRLLVTRRALSKRTWPGVWTNSCCGHPSPEEDVDQAVHRRVGQELGVRLEDLRVRLPDFRYRAVDVTGTVENEFCPVYTAVTTDQVRPDPAEIADTAWTEWADFVSLARRTPWAISPWAAEQIPLLEPELGGNDGAGEPRAR